ncbi:MAG TPA: hypothetical protein VED63_04920, partial [Acidimicrobiales bacterium]|nr:hypothetical protein [Acidimicrobiales bacterium]
VTLVTGPAVGDKFPQAVPMPPPPASALVGPFPDAALATPVTCPDAGNGLAQPPASMRVNGNAKAALDAASQGTTPLRQGDGSGDRNLAEEAKRALARARTVETPEAWQEAARVATLMAHMAQTMQVVTDAKQTAKQMAQAAERGTQQAEAAAQAALEAQRVEERAVAAAKDAAQVAQDAAKAATEAMHSAERATQAAPAIARAAETAAEAAADARRNAHEIEELVARAMATNTPEAWREAREISAAAARTPETGETSSREP